MTVEEAYKQNPSNLGSPKMVAIYEALTGVPSAERVVDPQLGGFSITSDGFVLSGNNFLGTAEDFERNLRGLFEHFEDDITTADALLAKVSDWRTPGFVTTSEQFAHDQGF